MQSAPLVVRTVPARRPRAPARPAARRRRGRLGAPRRGPRRLGRRRRRPHPRRRPLRRRARLVDASTPAPRWSATRSAARHRPGLLRLLRASPTTPATACWSSRRSSSAGAATRAWVTTIGVDAIPPAPVVAAHRRRRHPPAGVTFADGALLGRRVGDGGRRGGPPDQRRRPGEGRAGPRPAGHRRRARRRALAAAAGWPRATRCAGPSTSTGCSARRRRCWSAASAAWSPPGCWPAPSGAPATTTATCALAATLARVVQGPRGARVRRPLGGRRARAALHVDERARGAVRAAPAQRHAPGHRRRRGRARHRRRRVPRWSWPRRCTRRPRSAAPPPTPRPR